MGIYYERKLLHVYPIQNSIRSFNFLSWWGRYKIIKRCLFLQESISGKWLEISLKELHIEAVIR